MCIYNIERTTTIRDDHGDGCEIIITAPQIRIQADVIKVIRALRVDRLLALQGSLEKKWRLTSVYVFFDRADIENWEWVCHASISRCGEIRYLFPNDFEERIAARERAK